MAQEPFSDIDAETATTSAADSALTSVGDTLTTTIDDVWSELEGDIETGTTTTDGPFEVDDSSTYDDPFAIPALDDGALVGEPISVLIPWESDPGYLDPWSMPETGVDWTDFTAYDPMACCSDWTVDGWTDTTAFAPGGGYAPGFDSTWMSAPGSYYDDASYQQTPGYWDTTGYYDTTADLYADAFADPSAIPMTPFDAGAGMDGTGTAAPIFDATTGYDPTVYDTTATSLYDTTFDSSFDSTLDTGTSWDTTSAWDTSSSWETPTTEDSGWSVDAAFDESQFWMEEYQDASSNEWDLWNASVDASVAGDDLLAYDLNQASLSENAYAESAWDYSADAWNEPATTSTWDTSTTSTTSAWDTSTDTGSEW